MGSNPTPGTQLVRAHGTLNGGGLYPVFSAGATERPWTRAATIQYLTIRYGFRFQVLGSVFITVPLSSPIGTVVLIFQICYFKYLKFNVENIFGHFQHKFSSIFPNR